MENFNTPTPNICQYCGDGRKAAPIPFMVTVTGVNETMMICFTCLGKLDNGVTGHIIQDERGHTADKAWCKDCGKTWEQANLDPVTDQKYPRPLRAREWICPHCYLKGC